MSFEVHVVWRTGQTHDVYAGGDNFGTAAEVKGYVETQLMGDDPADYVLIVEQGHAGRRWERTRTVLGGSAPQECGCWLCVSGALVGYPPDGGEG